MRSNAAAVWTSTGFPSTSVTVAAWLAKKSAAWRGVCGISGEKTGFRTAGSRAVSRWESFVPGMDIVVLASPLLKVDEARDRELQIEMLYARLNPSDVERKK